MKLDPVHADLACSVQRVIEEVLLDLVHWLRGRTDGDALCLAGGVALNCVANSRIYAEGGFDRVWVQPASGDAGTALGAALSLAASFQEPIAPMPTAQLGRGWSDEQIRERFVAALRRMYPDFRDEDIVDFRVSRAPHVMAMSRQPNWTAGRSASAPSACTASTPSRP